VAKQKDFDAFLSNIEPSPTTVKYISSIHTNLRGYLAEHATYKDIHVHTFLSGSYAKHTCIRPKKHDGKRDVDIIVETSYGMADNSCDVLKELLDVILEKDIYSSAELHAHSVGIEMDGIEVDVVPVIRSDDGELYCIGTSDIDEWTLTNPKGHITWSSEVNANNKMKYKSLVKILKWWRRTNCPEDIKYPKGLALEKIIADNLPDSELNTENHLIGTMQAIVTAYQDDYISIGDIPVICDPCLENNNLLSNCSFSDFEAFISKLSEHLELIEESGTTNETWRTILGTEFPNDDTSTNNAKLAVNSVLNVPHRQKPLWNTPSGAAVMINAQLRYEDGKTIYLENNGDLIPKKCSLVYKALHGTKQPYSLKWQVVNTGNEATSQQGLRGGFEDSDNGINGKNESTAYTGKHYVQCFVIKGGRCVAKSKEFIINIE